MDAVKFSKMVEIIKIVQRVVMVILTIVSLYIMTLVKAEIKQTNVELCGVKTAITESTKNAIQCAESINKNFVEFHKTLKKSWLF